MKRPSNPASYIVRGHDCHRLTLDEFVKYIEYSYKKSMLRFDVVRKIKNVNHEKKQC